MISVVVGTRNKLKAEAVKEAFKKVFSDEVFRSAYNRAYKCYEIGGCDYFVGIEGGYYKI